MEIQLPLINFISLLLLSSFIVLLIKAWSKSKLPKKYKNLPPSPPKLPIIGHLHHMGGGPTHRSLAKMAQKYGPILHLEFGQVSTVAISSQETAKAVLQVHDPACADRPESTGARIMWYDYTDIALCPYGEYWRQMRKICTLELLSSKNVKSFGSIRRDEASRLVESLRSSSGTTINLSEKLFVYSVSMVCRTAFGKLRSDYNELIELVKLAHSVSWIFGLDDLFPTFKPLLSALTGKKFKLMRMRHRLDAILDDIMEEHRLKQRGEFGGEDIIDALLRLQKNEELEFSITNDNIKAIIFDMFAGGTETSSATIDWAMAELMRSPRAMANVQAEVRRAFEGKKTIENSDIQGLKYFKSVMKETLRMHPPVPIAPRACRDECTVNGYSIPLKSNVLVNLWAIGRNPEYWQQPDTFQPERFMDTSIDFLGNNFQYIPFGSGRRICPGMQFGLANIELALALLLYHFDWKMPDGMSTDDIDMTEVEGLVSGRKNGLFLVPTVYNASG